MCSDRLGKYTSNPKSERVYITESAGGFYAGKIFNVFMCEQPNCDDTNVGMRTTTTLVNATDDAATFCVPCVRANW